VSVSLHVGDPINGRRLLPYVRTISPVNFLLLGKVGNRSVSLKLSAGHNGTTFTTTTESRSPFVSVKDKVNCTYCPTGKTVVFTDLKFNTGEEAELSLLQLKINRLNTIIIIVLRIFAYYYSNLMIQIEYRC
jgi:hypothetical protein